MKVMVKRVQPKGPEHCRIRSNLNGINDVLHRAWKQIISHVNVADVNLLVKASLFTLGFLMKT